MTVTVSGEFCLDDSQRLRHALTKALATSEEGVDLDLGRLKLADCSALNVLLAARRDALTTGRTVTITAASPAAERLLTYTDTYPLFSPAHDHAHPTAVRPGRLRESREDGLLQTEVVQLRRALRTRPEIDLARGILMASFGLNADEAWEVLVTASQNTNTKLHLLAEDVVTAVQGTSLPDPVQRQLTAAVARKRLADGHPQHPARGDRTRRPMLRGVERS
ncbi:ANTAR domain-containing protein [Streptomyces broussonetiae]|uniref:ANTAR domain-containing protein n=2 Tax=Streptomyces broussonetiae TaxID=2686304 RepID=UPI001E35EE1D|nr:ANTAR domain-containing protein [Streptomyces broussonetiae]